MSAEPLSKNWRIWTYFNYRIRTSTHFPMIPMNRGGICSKPEPSTKRSRHFYCLAKREKRKCFDFLFRASDGNIGLIPLLPELCERKERGTILKKTRFCRIVSVQSRAGMAELVDAKDSKSFDRKVMRVRFSLPAPCSIMPAHNAIENRKAERYFVSTQNREPGLRPRRATASRES